MTSLEGWSSTIELRPRGPPRKRGGCPFPSVPSPGPQRPQREHHRHPRLPRRKPERPVLPPLHPVKPREIAVVPLVQEVDSQPDLDQRGNDLTQAVLEFRGPLMRKRGPVGVAVGIVL